MKGVYVTHSGVFADPYLQDFEGELIVFGPGRFGNWETVKDYLLNSKGSTRRKTKKPARDLMWVENCTGRKCRPIRDGILRERLFLPTLRSYRNERRH